MHLAAAAILLAGAAGPASALPAIRQGSGETWLLVVIGLGGDPAHTTKFSGWGDRLISAAREKYGLAVDHTVLLTEKGEGGDPLAAGRSDKEHIVQAVADIAGRAAAGDQVVIVLIGHGSFRAGTSRINLPGPDMTAEDFAGLLDRLSAQRVAFVNTTSASGEFVAKLSGQNRIVMTATKSGMEGNEATFAQYFVDALAGDGADTDKDGRVSMLEAFTYAHREVVRQFEQTNRLPTEHAVLDDDGDGKGVAEPDPAKGDGRLAGTVALSSVVGATRAAAPPDASPELRALYDQKQKIERSIEALKARKASMDPARYDADLERLLIDLAEKNQAIRKLEGKS